MDRADFRAMYADVDVPETRPDFAQLEDVEAIVATDLAKPIAEIMEIHDMGKQADHESLMDAVNKLRMALYARYQDI